MPKLGRRGSKPRREMTITKLDRDEKGHWKCRVTVGDETYGCHRKYGSWAYDEGTGPVGGRDCSNGRCHVPADVAEAIQAKVYPIERKERREKERAEAEAKAKAEAAAERAERKRKKKLAVAS